LLVRICGQRLGVSRNWDKGVNQTDFAVNEHFLEFQSSSSKYLGIAKNPTESEKNPTISAISQWRSIRTQTGHSLSWDIGVLSGQQLLKKTFEKEEKKEKNLKDPLNVPMNSQRKFKNNGKNVGEYYFWKPEIFHKNVPES